MPSTKPYCTDAELADLKSDTEGAKLFIDPPGLVPDDDGATLGRLDHFRPVWNREGGFRNGCEV
jgi:hypothetical protein